MPKPTVSTLVFFLKDDQILLAMKKRGFGKGRWNGAGGKVESGETLEQALVRECQEEICVTPLEWEKVVFHDFVMEADGVKPWHMRVHAYICRQWEGEPTETSEMTPRWFKIRDIPYAKMWHDDIVWLPLVLMGQKVRTTFHFDKDDHMIQAELKPVNELE